MDSRQVYQANVQSNLRNSVPFSSAYERRFVGASRVLRRRCRSEGLERSPFEIAHTEILHNIPFDRPPFFTAPNGCRTDKQTNGDLNVHRPIDITCKGCESVNSCLRHHLYSGDSGMAQEARINIRNPERRPIQSAQKDKYYSHHHGNETSNSLNKWYYSDTPVRGERERDRRLPRVEEMLDKLDYPMDFSMGPSYTKQPLKSILINSMEKTPPPSILKKSKNKYDCKVPGEAKRRQRALSESEYLVTSSYRHHDSQRQASPNPLTNMKRLRENGGTEYSRPTYVYPYTDSSPLGPSNGFIFINDRKSPTHSNGEQKRVQSPNAKVNVTNGHAVPESDDLPVKSRTTSLLVKKSSRTLNKKTKGKMGGPRLQTVKVHTKATVNDDSQLEDMKLPENVQPLNGPVGDADVVMQEPDSSGLKNQSSPPPPPIINQAQTKVNKAMKQLNLSNKPYIEQVIERAKLLSELTSSPGKELAAPLPNTADLLSSFRLSLFPRVPPYLRFVSHDSSERIKMPPLLQRHLQWKVTTITPIIVKKTLINSGFKLVRSDCDTSECPQDETIEWIGIWGKHMKSMLFRGIKDGQKMNHFPGTFQIGRKDRLWRNLQKLVAAHGPTEFGIMPRTYVLPADLKMLKHDWDRHTANNEKWIIKPPASARGTGIKVISRWTQIPKRKPTVVQRYVAKPYLINDTKFDLRLYVLVTSVHPLRIYLYKDGLARFASVKYSEELTSLHDRYMHLTNYSINRLSKNYTHNEDAASCQGHKWTLQTLLQYLKKERFVDTDALWESMTDLVIKTIMSGEVAISTLTKANVNSRYNCYELFGVDVLLDEDLKPWLLEVNISPSLHSASPLDQHVKGPLIAAVLNVAQYQLPTKITDEAIVKGQGIQHHPEYESLAYDHRLYTIFLSREEREKHITFTHMDTREEYLEAILTKLTPDDVRHLVQAEDELCGAGSCLQRIFPTCLTHRYLPLLPGPARYYNRLFDAWEHKYRAGRTPGVKLLTALCEVGHHLEMPAVPLKRCAASRLIQHTHSSISRDGSRMTSTRHWSAIPTVRRPHPAIRWARAISRGTYYSNRRRVASLVSQPCYRPSEINTQSTNCEKTSADQINLTNKVMHQINTTMDQINLTNQMSNTQQTKVDKVAASTIKSEQAIPQIRQSLDNCNHNHCSHEHDT